MVHCLPYLEEINEVCEGCQLGKQHRDWFPKGQAWRANNPLELIHTDLCGPMQTESIAGNIYFMLLIDDCRRMTWVYFLSGRKPGIGHLKVFGSLCYVHVPTETRHKLDAKSVKGVFVGYAVCAKGYRVFDTLTKKLLLSRDVVFDESMTWNWKAQTEISTAVTNTSKTEIDSSLQEVTEIDNNCASPCSSFQAEEQERNIHETAKITKPYDHTPVKWRSINDIMTQCNLYIVEPEKYEEAE
ncbi:unnamed protein product [Prunus armeniaca]